MKKHDKDKGKAPQDSGKKGENPGLDGENVVLDSSEEKEPESGGLTPKLAAMRKALTTDKARAMFDERVAELGDRAEGAMTGMSKAKGGLEATLTKLADAREAAEATVEPFGAALDQVPDLEQMAQDLLAELESDPMPGANFLPDKVDNNGSASWLPKVRTELKHLQKIQDGKREADEDFVRGIRNNLEGIAAEHADAEKMGDGTLVNNDITYSGGTLDIDNISADQKTWSEVKNKEPFGLGSSNWSDEIEPKAKKMKQAASEAPYKDTVETLRFSFPKGVSSEVKAALEAMGFVVDGPVSDP